jgi:hypothetical protein
MKAGMEDGGSCLRDGWGIGAFAILFPLFSIPLPAPGTAAAGLTGRFEHFMAKSSQVPLYEAFTHKTWIFRSNPVKASQTKSKGLTRDSTTNNMGFPLQAAGDPAFPQAALTDVLRGGLI